jgi:hypothetical protein
MTNSLVRIGGVEGEDLGPCQRNLAGIAVKKKRKKEEACKILPDSSQITPESGKVSLESLLRFVGITVDGYFGKKYPKWSRATHVTTVPLVNDDLTDIVLGLRDFETLKGSIVKIETLVAELEIAVNFSGVIRTFPY